MSDTPETDAQGFGDGRHPWVATDFACKLERERDDLQKAVNNLCNHLGVNPANTTLLAVEILKIIRERDEAREALRALAPLTYHDCHFSKDMMGNCILCKREETK